MADDGEVRFGSLIDAADRATSFVERPVRRLSGRERLNPFVHAGTISVFLLIVVVITGLYITLFFEFGYAASYDSVAGIEAHPLQKVVRALHRYSSALLVVTTIVHGWRIFAAQRFTGRRRRWRWASGVTSLTLVWLAGVTGYWLVWDRRAGAISEAVAELVSIVDPGTRYAVRNLLAVSDGSGSGLLLLIWFLHLGLTAVLGWFVYRHLRRSTQPWLPPRVWMIVVGLGLLVLSLALPVGMLEPYRPDRLVADMPLDPFVLFLLPPLLHDWRWLAALVMVLGPLVVALLPRLLRRADPPIVTIDAERCTGCTLCTVDCPYDALHMATVDTARVPRSPEGLLAVLEPSMCVGCGICLGSCAFDAIDFTATPAPPPNTDPGPAEDQADLTGRRVVVVCDRHGPDAVDDPDAEVVEVRCAGMVAAHSMRGYLDRGADDVELIGCAPADCRYGVGNQLAAERIAGERAPRVPRKFGARIATVSAARDDVALARHAARAADAEGSADARRAHAASSADSPSKLPAGALVLVLASLILVVGATRAPFSAPSDRAAIRVVVDHADGATLVGRDTRLGVLETVEVTVDGVTTTSTSLSGGASESVGWIDTEIAVGTHDVQVVAHDVEGASVVLLDEQAALFEAGDRRLLTVDDVSTSPVEDDGRAVFESRAAGCTVCHSIDPGDDGVGPTLYGVATVGGDRVLGLDAEQYLRQSILLPDQYVVEGWPAGQMLPIYRERLTAEQLDALIAYLLTLEEAS